MDIVSNIRSLARSGSSAERRVASMILADLDGASRSSIAELAEGAYVSEPTVTRFCRALGCTGMRDFKYRLAQSLAIGAEYLKPQKPPVIASGGHIVTSVIDDILVAVEAVRSQVDTTIVKEAAKRIAGARSILAFGSGGTSSMCATELHARLFRLGLSVIAHADGQMQRMTASVATEDTVIVGFSTSGFATSVIDAVRIGRHYGAFTITIAPGASLLARAGDLTLVMPHIVHDNPYKPSTSRYACLALVDILAMTTAETMGPQVLEGMRRIRQTLWSFKVDDPNQPLGD